MIIDLQNKISMDNNLKRYLYEDSYWYKYLNRNSNSFKFFEEDMKVKYKLTTVDKINKTIDNINMLQSFLDVFK